MTTLIGIKTNSELESIVLVSDCQITEYDSKSKATSRRSGKKIYYGESWAMGWAGTYHKELDYFFGTLRGKKNYNSTPEKARLMIGKAIEKKEFPEILELNKKIRKNGADMEDIPCFIFATTKPNLSLWWIDEYGNLKERENENSFEYIVLGSGEERAESYITDLISKEKIDLEKLSALDALQIGRGAIQSAEEDMGTGMGYDLVVLSEQKGVRRWREEIFKDLREAEIKRFGLIADYYEPKGV